MIDFWDNLVPMSAIALVGFFIYGLGHLILADMEKSKERYDQCISADMQWVEGNCVK